MIEKRGGRRGGGDRGEGVGGRMLKKSVSHEM